MSGEPPESLWFVYVIRCADGTLYTGVSTNVERRFTEHREGSGKGAKYLRGRGPLEMVCAQSIGTRSQALKVENRFRKLPKERKESLIAHEFALARLLSEASP